MKNRKNLLVGTFFILFMLTACTAPQQEVGSTAEPEVPAGIIAEGRLVPVDWLDQSFTMSGKVEEVLVVNGDLVEVGDVLARLQASPDSALALARAQEEVLASQQAMDSLEASADLSLAQAEQVLLDAQQEYENAQSVFDANTSDVNKIRRDVASASLQLAEDAFTRIENGGGIDPLLLAAAESRQASAAAGLQSAQSLIDAHELKANLSGTIVDLNLKAGMMIAPVVPVAVVADYGGWLVKTDNLSETQVADVAVGDQVEVYLDALPDLSLSGEVTYINSRFEEKRGDITFTVTIKVNETDPRMRWGMTAAVKFMP